MLNFATSPYYDDFDEAKKFLRILFRPGYAVQTRELTQIQSILQNQISRFGSHIFKEGAMVSGGDISFDTKVGYVKLKNLNGSSQQISSFLSEFEGTIITGQTSQVSATVVKAVASENSDPHTLFVKYNDSGSSTTTKVLLDNEEIISDATTPRSATLVTSGATGFGSLASVKAGIFYTYGNFVLADEQTIVLDKYTNTPSYRIGLSVVESIVTSDEDASLNDNAQGSFNYAAPGAHRYKISLVLSKLDVNSTSDSSFIELLRVKDGAEQVKVTKTDYSVIEQTLARRTKDESGDYTVRPFAIQVREHRNNSRGAWVKTRSYLVGDIVTNAGNTYVAKTSGTSGATAPTHLSGDASDGSVTWNFNAAPTYNNGVYDALDIVTPGDDTKLAIGLEPGKAYVNGYEIEKSSTVYVDVRKTREFYNADNTLNTTHFLRANNIKTTATVGNYVLVKNVFSFPENITQFQQIDLYDQFTATGGTASGSKVGSARVRGVELDSSGNYKLFLFDVVMNSGKVFERHVKQFFYNNAAMFDFTADIAPVQTTLSGSLTSYTTSGRTTQGSGQYIKGVGTKFTTELTVGDYIQVNGTAVRVTAITDNYTVDVSSAVNVIGVLGYLDTTQYVEPDNSILIFPLNQGSIRKIRSADDTTVDTTYTITRNLGSKTTNSSGVFDFSTTTSGETFASTATTNNYLVVNTSTGAIATPTIILNSGSTTATFSGLTPSTSYTVLAAINKSGIAAKEKTKAVVTGSTIDFTTSATATAKELLLGKADIYKLTSVMMSTGFGAYNATGAVDVTANYTLDNGQRTTHYDIGRLTLNAGKPAPTGTLRVTFDYFSHNTGDYFSVDSYVGAIPYSDINPLLRDSFDFRPIIDSSGNFSGNELTAMPKRGVDIQADYSYYLGRRDKVCLDPNGNFFVVEGIPSLTPSEPADPAVGMVLYKLTVAPYCYSATSDNVHVDVIDNKRYTMRDIGKIDKRLENVEYYTSLSMLEQETKSLAIPDEFGLDRYKNGFIVDNFEGHGVGDVTSSDYVCSIDMEKNELRPFFTMDNVNLIEKNTSDALRNSDGYQLTGDMITLKYSDLAMITQPYASRTENVNPFAVFTFIGTIGLNPSSDEWFEVNRRPDIIINQEGNFNTIRIMAEKAGVLGTVWNSWQTQWTGSSTNTYGSAVFNPHGGFYTAGAASAAQSAANILLNISRPNTMARTITVEQTATTVGQARTGIRTNIVAKVDNQQIDDKVLSTAVIPYIRSRNVLFLARGLKPSTTFFPYFDDTAIGQFVTPATQITFNTVIGFGSSFDFVTNVGGLSNEAARRIGGNADTSLNKGDVITGLTSGATAIVALQENLVSGGKNIYVVNVQGTFQTGETFEGSISGARGIVATNITVASQGGSLVSTTNGDVVGLFKIPNTDSLKFRTGIREFKLADSNINNSVNITSQGKVQYRAQGILETKQATILSTRNAELVQEVVNQTQTVVETSSRVVGDTGWWDPLAQTFLVQQRGGAFLTKIDVFFQTKDATIPVQMEIREVVNGYPGKKVLPFSRVVKTPDQVYTSADGVNPDVTGKPLATTFTFESPVYVQDATEYCIVLMSDSNNYKVWISQIGEQNVGTDRFISEQPYAGVLFKSQNASTWTADQLQDLKFTVHRAVFETSVNRVVTFVNDALPLVNLDVNPFQTASGSNLVRIYQPAHGMPNGSTVIVSGVATGTYNNIPSTELNGPHAISNVDYDTYTITSTTLANKSGLTGSTGVQVTKNVRYDSVQPVVASQTFPDTTLAYTANTLDTTYAMSTTPSPVVVNDNNPMAYPCIIASETNESLITPASTESFRLYANLYTDNDSVSPVIDTHRLSLITTSNKIDYPTDSLNIAVLDSRTVLSSVSTVAIDGASERLTTSDANTQAAFKTVLIGKEIVISGTSSNNGTFVVSDVASDGSYIGVVGNLTTESPTTLTLVSKETYVDEIAPVNSTSKSKYVTKTINLNQSSTFFKLLYAYSKPQEADIRIYYKTVPVGSNATMDSTKYTLLSPTNPLVTASDVSVFNDVEYELDNLAEFNQVKIKIVMNSTSTAKVPRIKDFRVICCA